MTAALTGDSEAPFVIDTRIGTVTGAVVTLAVYVNVYVAPFVVVSALTAPWLGAATVKASILADVAPLASMTVIVQASVRRISTLRLFWRETHATVDADVGTPGTTETVTVLPCAPRTTSCRVTEVVFVTAGAANVNMTLLKLEPAVSVLTEPAPPRTPRRPSSTSTAPVTI